MEPASYLLPLVATLLLAALVPVLDGVERKFVRARVQSRVGPPVLQTVYDIVKLVRKEVVMPSTASPLFIAAPAAASAMSLSSLALIPYGLGSPLGFEGDMLLVAYLLASSSVLLVLGGSASGNPLSEVSCSRELSILVPSELLLAFSLATIAVKHGSLSIARVSATFVPSVSLLLAYVALLYYAFVKSARTPYDVAEAEPEVASGYMIEYSGALLALVILSNLFKRFAATSLFVVLSLGPQIRALMGPGSPYGQLVTALLTVALSALAYLALGLVSAVYGRYRVVHAVSSVRLYTLIPLVALLLSALGL